MCLFGFDVSVKMLYLDVRRRAVRSWRIVTSCLTAGIIMSPVLADGQDFPDVQRITNKVLFAGRDAAERKQAAERLRVEELDRRTRQQTEQLQEQAVTVHQLSQDLTRIQDERQLLGIAQEFDAAIAAGRWSQARSFLTEVVTIDLGPQGVAPQGTIEAGAFLASLQRYLKSGSVLPRSGQQAQIQGDKAVLTSQGYGWVQATERKTRSEQQFGTFKYTLGRSQEGWKIDGVMFSVASSGPVDGQTTSPDPF